MAKEKEHHESKPAKKKLKLTGIHTQKAADGAFVHHDHYEDEKGHPLPPKIGGVSDNMDEVHQYYNDRFGDGEEQQPGGDGTPAQGDPAAAAAAQ